GIDPAVEGFVAFAKLLPFQTRKAPPGARVVQAVRREQLVTVRSRLELAKTGPSVRRTLMWASRRISDIQSTTDSLQKIGVIATATRPFRAHGSQASAF
ncbi:hypothetical protein, partial [Mesorhizobium sp. M7A.F.Ca.CA.001.09.1.1]|uniref:hypothetical protein n=1 Tax=Mesorhizobium sp. M7A.F.Ca.CA.001.09.1.1 TaxID=2496718 RepID=UPI001FE0E8F6